jgi:hypothetical protein
MLCLHGFDSDRYDGLFVLILFVIHDSILLSYILASMPCLQPPLLLLSLIRRLVTVNKPNNPNIPNITNSLIIILITLIIIIILIIPITLITL